MPDSIGAERPAAALHICALSDLPAGGTLRVASVTPPIALFRTEDREVFAVDDTCTHQDASLADGWFEGCTVECPLHASTFDLRTGAVDAPPAKRPLRTHRVTIEEDQIYVTVSDLEPVATAGRAAGTRQQVP